MTNIPRKRAFVYFEMEKTTGGCSNQAKSGMNTKTLQYLMGHSEIGVTTNVYIPSGVRGRCGRADADGGCGERTA